MPIDQFFDEYDKDYPLRAASEIAAARNDKGSPGPLIIVSREVDTSTRSPSRYPSPCSGTKSPLRPPSTSGDEAIAPYPNIAPNLLVAGNMATAVPASAGSPPDLSAPITDSDSLLQASSGRSRHRRSTSRSRPNTPTGASSLSLRSYHTMMRRWNTSLPHIGAAIMRSGQIGTHITMIDESLASPEWAASNKPDDSPRNSMIAVRAPSPGNAWVTSEH